MTDPLMLTIYTIICIGAISGVVNMFLQAYDIVWCRWHDCGKSSKNSTAHIIPSEDFPTQSVGSLPKDYIKETK